ncbi:hypothetical protein [Bacteroides sp. AF32-8BH]|uniref:hypothetical protein n=1 Tax=Bacteroides sp. AF32-8BH TaxID=2302925 RepID=UPI000E41F2F5|nr:hypothetical protein [Bacteroides sp. AF32-8BH]RGE77155.1 hypothetical protein DWZ47_19175 [Bacteroides sp. AF32-8BH]
MATNLILSKESSESEIKRYFNAVLELSKSDNEFPINLDEVWMLVYPRKDHAVRELIDGGQFIEGVDYQVSPKNGENPKGGRPTNEYKLTVSCMEFFIARKVRPVFEVYRQVFHQSVRKVIENQNKPKREPSLTTKVRVGLEWVKGVSEVLNLNDSSKLSLISKVAAPLGLPTPDYTPSHGILKSATELLKEAGLSISAQSFNQRAIQKGILCDMKRKSSKGRDKYFKSITESGLSYGENQVNPNNPKETQPLWYEEKFNELLMLLDFKLARVL